MPYVHFWILGVNDASCSAEVLECRGSYNRARPDADMQHRPSVAEKMSSDHHFGKHVSHIGQRSPPNLNFWKLECILTCGIYIILQY